MDQETRQKQRKELEGLIANGYKPHCPLCGEKLSIDEQEGLKGGNGYSYSCPNQQAGDCELRPGFVAVSSLGVVKSAFQKKMVGMSLSFIGGLTIAGLIAVFSSGSSSADGEAGFWTLPFFTQADTASMNAQTEQQYLSRIEALENRLSRTDTACELSFQQKLDLGLFYSGKSLPAMKDVHKSKELLFEVLENHQEELNDDQRALVVELLAGLRHFVTDTQSANAIIHHIETATIRNNKKFISLAEFHYVMGYALPVNNNFYRLQSLFYYLKTAHLQVLSQTNFQEFASQLNFLHSNTTLLAFWNPARKDSILSVVQAGTDRNQILSFANELSAHL